MPSFRIIHILLLFILSGIRTIIPSCSWLSTIWQAILDVFSLNLGVVSNTSIYSSEGGFNLSLQFSISTLQVVQANCLSHSPYILTFSLTRLFVTSIRFEPALILEYQLCIQVTITLSLLRYELLLAFGFQIVSTKNFSAYYNCCRKMISHN